MVSCRAVSINSGSTTVNGVNTRWATAGINPGASFRLDGLPDDYEVAEVVSDTKLTLVNPYYGSNISGKTYSIDRNFQSTSNAEIAHRVVSMLGKYETYVDEDMKTVQGESAYDIARRLGKTTAATEAAWIDELKNGEEYVALKNTVSGLVQDNAGNHNAKYIEGAMTFTNEVSANIRNGSFKDLYPGKTFSFSNIPYKYLDANDEEQSSTYSGTMRVADLDYYLLAGDQDNGLGTHHIVVVPDTNMYIASMNATSTTEGGYVGSKIRTVHLRRAEAIFKACFGENHILTHREYLTTAVTNGRASAGTWCNSLVELMDERMVYGACQFDSSNPDGSAANADGTNIAALFHRYSVSCKQLNLFRHRPDLISNQQWYWLRNVVSAAYFATVLHHGSCNYSHAGRAGGGVRPAALIY